MVAIPARLPPAAASGALGRALTGSGDRIHRLFAQAGAERGRVRRQGIKVVDARRASKKPAGSNGASSA
ncbi:MAG: hypothetical protein U5L06_10765 [Rhodovibrio sp.]|nr:hypothetical protein [Rhodovibrio sp.]